MPQTNQKVQPKQVPPKQVPSSGKKPKVKPVASDDEILELPGSSSGGPKPVPKPKPKSPPKKSPKDDGEDEFWSLVDE